LSPSAYSLADLPGGFAEFCEWPVSGFMGIRKLLPTGGLAHGRISACRLRKIVTD
jgi:hypothetical protein